MSQFSVFASGLATSPNGAALARAVIDLYAWPFDKVLQSLQPRQEVPRILITTTTTNSSGKFTLNVSPSVLSANAVSGGYANLEADAGGAAWFFTMKASAPSVTGIHLADVTSDSPGYCGP